MFINPINQNFCSSRVKVSKAHTKAVQNKLKSYSEMEIMAAKRNVYLEFSPLADEQAKTRLRVFKKGIDHVADIPEYAVQNNTGDQVYIPWIRQIYQEDLSVERDNVVNSLKRILRFGD